MSPIFNNLGAMPPKPRQDIGPAAYRAGLCKRLKEVRLSLGLGPKEMADLLGIKVETYKKYETRSPLPHYLIPRVLEISGYDAWYFMTGKAPATAPKSENR